MKRKEFDALVQAALEKIPQEFRDALQNIEIIVEDWPDPRMLEEVLEDRNQLVYGLFVGTPLPERSFDSVAQLPAVIFIYQGPLVEDFLDREELAREIQVTLVHEIAHFLGFDESTLEEYGYG